MSQDNVNLVRKAYEAFGRGDMPGVFSVMDDRIEFVLAENSPYTDGESLVGPEQIAERLFRRLEEEWDGFEVRPAVYHDAGDVVVCEGRFGGTCKATGRVNNAQFAHIWTVRNGKLARLKEYADTAMIGETMGVGAGLAARV